jgi:hypothetical protein
MAVNIMGDTHEVFKFKEWGRGNAMAMLISETESYLRELRGIQGREVLDIEYVETDTLHTFHITLAPQSNEEFEAYLERLRAR